MEYQIGTHLPDLWEKGPKKEQWPLPAPLYGRKLTPWYHPDTRQFSSSWYVSDTFNLLAPQWSSEGISPSKSVYRLFKRNCLGLQKFVFYCLNPIWFLELEVMETYLLGSGSLGLGF